MKHAGCTRSAIDAFVHNFEQLRSAASMMIPEDAIFPARRPPPQHRPPLPRRHRSSVPPRWTSCPRSRTSPCSQTGRCCAATRHSLTEKNMLTHHTVNRSLLQRTVMLKLNGGLGTGMGLEKAKSLLPVSGDDTFLDLIAKQVLHMRHASGGSLAFLLMNSFSTSVPPAPRQPRLPHPSFHPATP